MMIKNFGLAALCCLASTSAFASGTFAPGASGATSATVAQLDDVNTTIDQLTLYADGTLTVLPRNQTKPVTTLIAPANLDAVLSLAEVLSQDPVTTDHRSAVCLIEIADGGKRALSVGQYDATSQRFVGNEDHVVLTNNGCWNLTYTHPTDAAGLNDAQSLETMLLTLGNQALDQ